MAEELSVALPADGLASARTAAPSILPQPVADRWEKLRAHPLAQRAALPALGATVLVTALFLWLFLSTPDGAPLYSDLPERDKAAVVEALEKANFKVRLDPRSGAVLVPQKDHARARMILARESLPNAAPGSEDLIQNLPLGTSRAVEGAHLKSAQERALALSIETLRDVKQARVLIARPDPSPFVRDQSPVKASITITLAPGRSLSQENTRAIVHLVAGAIPGLSPDHVAIADQTGRLLAGEPESADERTNDRRLQTQSRLERKMRESILQLLTPLVGEGNVTAEVSADLDFSARETSQEQYAPEGSVRSEATKMRKSSDPRAIGIPGAVSNTIPSAAEVSERRENDGTTTPTEERNVEESATRNYEIGRSVEVTSRNGSQLLRLTAAVAIKADALGTGKNRERQLADIQSLVEGAVGYNEARGDRITVIARDFAPVAVERTPLWEQPVIVDSSKWLGAALVLLGLILFIIRPLMKRIPTGEKEEDAPEAAIAIDGGTLWAENGEAEDEPAIRQLDYTGKLAEMRQIASSDTARATAIARRLLDEEKISEMEE